MPELTDQEIDKAAEGLSVFADDDEIVSRWIVLVEVINKDGERELVPGCSPGLIPFEINGMLYDALNDDLFDFDEED